jgi:hypothetical protein
MSKFSNMKKITLNIHESKYEFFLEVMKDFGFVCEPNGESYSVPEKDKELVRNRIKNAKPGDYLKWEEVKNSFRFGDV